MILFLEEIRKRPAGPRLPPGRPAPAEPRGRVPGTSGDTHPGPRRRRSADGAAQRRHSKYRRSSDRNTTIRCPASRHSPTRANSGAATASAAWADQDRCAAADAASASASCPCPSCASRVARDSESQLCDGRYRRCPPARCPRHRRPPATRPPCHARPAHRGAPSMLSFIFTSISRFSGRWRSSASVSHAQQRLRGQQFQRRGQVLVRAHRRHIHRGAPQALPRTASSPR